MTRIPGELSDRNLESEFRSIVRNFSPQIYRHASFFLGDPEEASEALQDILLNVYRSLPCFRRDSALATWVYRIALNTLYNFRRRRHHSLPTVDPKQAESIVDERSDAEEILCRKETKEQLSRCIAKLPPRESAAVTMFYIDGLGYKEIASLMETSPGSIGLLLHRGREHLHALLTANGKKEGL
jgi:RNA polymerase sigma-70 factor, ECF subfamily